MTSFETEIEWVACSVAIICHKRCVFNNIIVNINVRRGGEKDVESRQLICMYLNLCNQQLLSNKWQQNKAKHRMDVE